MKKEMFFEEEGGGIEVVEYRMESLTATDVVEANLTSSVSSPPSFTISSIDDLDFGELIRVKVNDNMWLHGRVSDVDTGCGSIERYVKFDWDASLSDASDKLVPLNYYPLTDIRRQFLSSPSQPATTSTPPQVGVSSFSEETAVKTTTELAVEEKGKSIYYFHQQYPSFLSFDLKTHLVFDAMYYY